MVQEKGKGKKREEMSNDLLTGNRIGDKAKVMVRNAWGTRSGELKLS